MRPFGNLEAVVLREEGVVHVPSRLLQRLRELLVVNVADPLEEEEREDVGLEVGGINGAAQDVCGLPEVGLKSLEVDGM